MPVDPLRQGFERLAEAADAIAPGRFLLLLRLAVLLGVSLLVVRSAFNSGSRSEALQRFLFTFALFGAMLVPLDAFAKLRGAARLFILICCCGSFLAFPAVIARHLCATVRSQRLARSVLHLLLVLLILLGW